MEWLNELSPWWAVPLGLVGGAVLIGLFHIPSEIMHHRRMRRERARILARFERDMLELWRPMNPNPSKKQEAIHLMHMKEQVAEFTARIKRR